MVDHNGEFVAAGLMLMLICCSQASTSSLSNAEEGGGGCPESEGFYKPRNSGQCFKLYKWPPRSWSAAKAWCVSEGMALAKVEDDIVQELSQYLGDALCPGRWCYNGGAWVGGRYDSGLGSFVWDHDNSELSNTNPYWEDGEPGGALGNDDCLRMWPGLSRPYYSDPCSWERRTLCEVIGA